MINFVNCVISIVIHVYSHVTTILTIVTNPDITC